MKKYIWAFPGLGKSSINNARIVDADCEQFKYIFPGVVPGNLHRAGGWEGVVPNPEYPENYFNYIDGLDADIVLLNCHISFLERLDKEQVSLVYPCEDLIVEYLERYRARGDHSSFVSYMAEEAPGMIRALDNSEFKKYKVFKRNTYLSDLFERNDFKVKVMTRNELTEQLQRAIDLNVLDLSFDGDVVCDISKATAANFSSQTYNASELAENVLNGAYGLDIDQLNKVCAEREAQIEKEKIFAERRGGLSREELEDKIMKGIVNGALSIYHGQIAPYSYGYEVAFGGNSWHCYCDFFEIPGKIASSIENGDRGSKLDVTKMLSAVGEMEEGQITKFIPEKETDFVRWGSRGYGSRGSIATVRDVHNGKGLDGIAQHHYHGDYSSITTTSQNNLVETLVYMKGFCLDCLGGLDVGPTGREKVVEYLKKHGTDISTPEKLAEWIKTNPEKCGKEENRAMSIERQQALYEQAYYDVVNLNTLVNEFKGSLDDLCTKLGGHNFDGTLFDVNYGVLTATIEKKNGKLVLNQKSIDIWDDNLTNMVQECIPTIKLKAICRQLGVDVGDNKDYKREGYNDAHILYAQAYCDFVELKAVVESYQSLHLFPFEELCRDLGGDRYDDDTFRLNYGVLGVSVGRDLSDKVFLCESAIGIWDDVREVYINDDISFKRLKETCEEIGFSIDALEAKALDISKGKTLSLDDQISKCEAKKETIDADAITKAMERGEFR